MLIFGVHEGERVAVDVPLASTVGEVKKIIQNKLNIYFDELVKQDKKVLVVSYAGSDLNDSWIFTDLGIIPGSTVKVCMKEEVKPVLYVRCSHSGELLDIMEDYNVEKMLVEDLRTLVAKKSGLPVTVFRLVTVTGLELYDGHVLFDYNIECGNIIKMETWNGWTEFINYSIIGITPSVMPLISTDEIISRFQLKVALYISAHFGNVDLAKNCMRLGARPDEAIGEHPSRQWCHRQSHIESLRTPVHEAAEFGQLGVLRLFITSDITCSMARDGHNLTPLNLALRKGQKPCASFLLTKQWTRVPVTKNTSVTLQTFRKVKVWCERCKEKAFMKYGPNKSSLKRRSFNTGPLVTHGVIVDGFSESPMTGKSKAENPKERKTIVREANEVKPPDENSPESYFKHLTALQTYGPKFRQNTKWGKMVGKSAIGGLLGAGLKNVALTRSLSKIKQDEAGQEKSTSDSSEGRRESVSDDREETKASIKLPPIKERSRLVSMSQPSVVHPQRITEEDGSKERKTSNSDKLNVSLEKGRKYIRTGPTASKSTRPLSNSLPNMKIKGPEKEKSKEKEKQFDARSVSSARSDTKTPDRATTATSRMSRKRKIPSAMLLPKTKQPEGTVPLPVDSADHDLRPFFYHNGQREEDILNPMVNLVAHHQGINARDRAMKSLAIANTFKGKPWLVQVQMAMSLTTSTLKREVTNLRHSFHEVSNKKSSDGRRTAISEA